MKILPQNYRYPLMSGIKDSIQLVQSMVGKDGSKKVYSKGEFLNKIRQVDEYIAETIENSLDGVNNPFFEVLGKEAKYNIAMIKIKSKRGKKLGSCALSVSEGNKNAPDIKLRLCLPDGTQSKGFYAGGLNNSTPKFVIETQNKNGDIERRIKTAVSDYTTHIDMNIGRVERNTDFVGIKSCTFYNNNNEEIGKISKDKYNQITLKKSLGNGSVLTMTSNDPNFKTGKITIKDVQSAYRKKEIIKNRMGYIVSSFIGNDGIQIYLDRNFNLSYPIPILEGREDTLKNLNYLKSLIGKPLPESFIKCYGLTGIFNELKNNKQIIKDCQKIINPTKQTSVKNIIYRLFGINCPKDVCNTIKNT